MSNRTAADSQTELTPEQLLDVALVKSAPRTELPAKLDRFPWALLAPVARLCLRLHEYLFRDQRHVNAHLIVVLRSERARATTAEMQLNGVRREQRELAERFEAVAKSQQQAIEKLETQFIYLADYVDSADEFGRIHADLRDTRERIDAVLRFTKSLQRPKV